MLSKRSRLEPIRHDLLFVSPPSWRSLLKTRQDLAQEPLVAEWVDQGWPLIARRLAPDDTGGLAAGLPMPPFAGKRRLALLLQPGDVISTTPPPLLSAAIGVAPETWRPALSRVTDLAAAHGVEARVVGSLAWRLLTGLEYVTAESDVDLVLPLPDASRVAWLTAGLATIEAGAPMRLDGELVRGDGAGVNWRELHAAASDVLVKTIRDVSLQPTRLFLSGQSRP